MFNGLQFGQNLLLSRWVDKLEADANDGPAMWQYVAISFAVIVAVVCRSVPQSLSSRFNFVLDFFFFFWPAAALLLLLLL